ERTRRTIHGAKISAITTAATTAASTASRAVLSEPVAWRKTRPAAITSPTPIPVRDTTAARALPAGRSAGGATVSAAEAPARKPPAAAGAMKARRTTSGSIPKWRAIPAHTPATMRWSGSRRTARTGDAAEPIASIFAASAGAGETAGEQDRPQRREGDRGELR